MGQGFFVHPPQESGSAEMARFANQSSRRCGPVVHGCTAKRARIFMTIRALITRQANQCCRNVIARFRYDANVARVVTSLASGGTNVIEAGDRNPGRLVMAGIATSRRRHVVGGLVIHAGEADQVAGIARTCCYAGMGVGCDQWQPCCARPVTDVTGLGSRDMHRRLAGSNRAVVATGAGLATDLGDRMGEAGRRPGRRQVADIAGTAGSNVICRFDLRPLRCIAAGMASQALAGRSGVTHGGRSESREVLVAGIALGCCWNMPRSRRLGLGILRDICTAVTGSTLPGRSGVVHGGRCKCGVVLVTGIALRSCRNVRAGLAQSGRIIVTVRTGTDSRRCVSKRRTTPERRRLVAGIALRRRTDVSRGLRECIDREITSVVTGRALTGHARMIHLCRRKSCVVLVARVTGNRGRDMRRIFAQRRASVVATGTTSGSHPGVGVGGWLPQRCRMTDVTGLRCRNMSRRLGQCT